MPAPLEYAVESYSIGNLIKIIASHSKNPEFFIAQKNHKDFFEEYFSTNGLAARTIVIESDYIDRDFLDDFAAYYVRCFKEYPRRCTRLHFFTREFTHEEFDALLGGATGALQYEDLRRSYLGFIVLKRLPKYVLGRSCLAAYPEERGRCYPIRREYEAHLFGMPLSVHTLPFQEQDSTAAACATSALWTVFQGTGKLFNHEIPSPVKITELASNSTPTFERKFPNHGLTVLQMTNAMRSVGLEPLVMTLRKENAARYALDLKSTIYAYLRARIPIALGIHIPNQGGHAVAITGFRLNSSLPPPSLSGHTRLLSSCIDQLYVHDDQLGPFSRMEFTGPLELKLNWRNGTGRGIPVVPTSVIVPLYHKIRIPIELVLNVVSGFYEGLAKIPPDVSRHFGITPDFKLVWDIHLIGSTDLKTEIAGTNLRTQELRRELLVQHFPRFIWRAKGLSENRQKPIVDLLFDATDLENGDVFIRAIEYDTTFSIFLRTISPFVSKALEDQNREEIMIIRSIFNSFK